jgi:hypothetical protein
MVMRKRRTSRQAAARPVFRGMEFLMRFHVRSFVRTPHSTRTGASILLDRLVLSLFIAIGSVTASVSQGGEGEKPSSSNAPAASVNSESPTSDDQSPLSIEAPADAGDRKPDRETLVVNPTIGTFYVSSLGNSRWIPNRPWTSAGTEAGGNTRDCDNIATHTDADFTGGAFVVQAGFAEQEIAAASYTLDPSAFPIKIISTEVIVATSNTIVTTTTRWTMLFWAGTPQNGTLLASFSSDGELLPNIVIGPGTNGVNLLFAIDPNDPDQIIINNNGSNTFSIGFRIDEHHQQTGSGCSSGDIPSNRNAFPTTDVSGLAQAAKNWLRGINCGPFGCPANGGWSNFASLPFFCRPSGDWVMRANWTSLNCQAGVGACCLANGTCNLTTPQDCQGLGGTYKGDGTNCQTDTCPAPTGACCFTNNFCLTLKEIDCAGAGGSWLGGGTQCNNNQCPSGACCLPDGSCVTATQSQCAAQNGIFRGVGSACATANCPQPTGACCLPNGFCLELTSGDCAGIPGGQWQGAFTTCADGNGDGKADICTCPADFDQTGFVDTEDFDAFVRAYELGDQSADFDQTGFVDTDDFDAFVVAFEAGC